VGNSSYLNFGLLPVSPGKKKRQHQSEGMKDIKNTDHPDAGYGVREISTDTEEVGFGENRKNMLPGAKNVADAILGGPDSLNPQVVQWPRFTDTSMYTRAAVSHRAILRKVLAAKYLDQVRTVLNDMQAKGLIPEGVSPLTGINITLADGTKVTPAELSEQQAQEALKILMEQNAEKPAPEETPAAPPVPGGAPAVPGAPVPESGPLAGLAAATQDMQGLLGGQAAARVPYKTAKKERFPLGGEIDVNHQERKMPEQMSKDEEDEVSFNKTHYEPNRDTKPYLQQGNGNDNAETAFAGDPMWSNTFCWQVA